jgi:hypothetical protein
MDDGKPLVAFIMLVLFFLGVLIGGGVINNGWKAEAVKLGYAEYHSTTGEWQWKRPSRDQGVVEKKDGGCDEAAAN